jgi:phosphoglycerate kinase
MTHLGSPKGFDKSLTLKPIYDELSKLIKKEIKKDITFKTFEELEKEYCNKIDKKEENIVLLENIRFHKEDTKNEKSFSKRLSNLGAIFVNDGFGVMHRKHCSTFGVGKFLPSFVGPLCIEEIENLDFSFPKKPFLVLLGGKKLSTKIPVIKALLKKADYIFLGGAMVFTFYKAKSLEIGKSLYEKELIKEAKALLKHKKILLPTDILCSKSIEKPAQIAVKGFDFISPNDYGVDIGTKSIAKLEQIIKISKTIFWNGPFGIFEVKEFSYSTQKLIGFLKRSKAKKIAGGGDSVMAINKFKSGKYFDFISTGGGASLDFIANGTLPYFELLKKNKNKTGLN